MSNWHSIGSYKDCSISNKIHFTVTKLFIIILISVEQRNVVIYINKRMFHTLSDGTNNVLSILTKEINRWYIQADVSERHMTKYKLVSSYLQAPQPGKKLEASLEQCYAIEFCVCFQQSTLDTFSTMKTQWLTSMILMAVILLNYKWI